MNPEVVVKDKELVQRLESEWLALAVSGVRAGVRVGKAAPAVQR